MSTRFPKPARVRLKADFQRLLRAGDVFPGAQVLVRRVSNPVGEARLGISASRRYGSAIRRNRLKRLVREAFRAIRKDLGAFDYFVSPRRHLDTPTLDGIRADLLATKTRRPAPRRTR